MASFATAFVNPYNYIGGVCFNPDNDILDLTGKVVLVTGGMFDLNPPISSASKKEFDA